MKSRFATSLLCASALTLTITPAFAQKAPAEDQQADDADVSTGEIIVTATLQRESLQKVPVAVSAYNTESLEKSGVSDIRSLQQITPSFSAQSSVGESNGTNLRIRGVGTFGINSGLESSVGVFVDGVYLSRPGIIMGEMVDLEQVEVLRGPQGTLFGRNTSVGLLNIKTKKPSLEKFSGWANASYGNYDLLSVQGGISAPLSSTAAASLSGAYRNRDGFIKNVGFNSGDKNRYLLRGQLYFEPSADLNIRLIADYSKFNEVCCNPTYIADSSPLKVPGVGLATLGGPFAAFGALGLQNLYQYNGLPADGGVTAGRFGEDAFNNYLTSDSTKPVDRARQWGLSGTIVYNMGGAELTSITSYRDFLSTAQFGVPFLNGIKVLALGNLFQPSHRTMDVNAKTFSQELRLAGKAFDDKLDWMIGGYFGNEKLDTPTSFTHGPDIQPYLSALYDFAVVAGGGPLPAPNALRALAGGVDISGSRVTDSFIQKGTTWSIFTNETFALADTFKVNVGLRYGRDTKTTTYKQTTFVNQGCLNTLVNPAAPPVAQSLNCLNGFPSIQRAVAAFPFLAGAPLPFPKEGDYRFSDGRLSYTVKLLWSPTPQLNTYASLSRGFKSGGQNHDVGGFNAFTLFGTPGPGPNFSSEINDSYELGMKFRTRDGKVQINAAAFLMDIKNYQTYSFNGVGFDIFSVPKAKSSGFEVEATVRPMKGFSLIGGVSYADARFPTDCAGKITATAIADLCGYPLQNAPKWSLVGGFDWTTGVGSDLQLGFNANVKYQSSYYASDQAVSRTVAGTGTLTAPGIDPFNPQNNGTKNANLFLGGWRDGYAKFNLRASLGKEDGAWILEGWVNNLTNKATTGYVFNGPFRPGSAGSFIDEARTYGLTVRTKF